MINSLLDNDLYKFTMMQAVLELYPDTIAEYQFINRGKQILDQSLLDRLKNEIYKLSTKKLLETEAAYLQNFSFFKPSFISYLLQYRFNPSQVDLSLNKENSLALTIKGPWRDTILWEVPLMAMISQIYFEGKPATHKSGSLTERTEKKATHLDGFLFADFGTRRRRSFDCHNTVVTILKNASSFIGTSNVKLAMDHSIKPIGTMAHEWIMAISALEGLRHANRFALRKWKDVYNADLGIALTDTFGTKAFWNDFDLELSKVYDGVRHDSGDPFTFGEAAIDHYKSLKIDPMSKLIVFSDGLNADLARRLGLWFQNRIKVSFGIGTNFTNDFDDPALNIVIKLRAVDGVPVIKLSDERSKATGDADAIRVAKWTFQGKPLDQDPYDGPPLMVAT